jgi:hypothetical protein
MELIDNLLRFIHEWFLLCYWSKLETKTYSVLTNETRRPTSDQIKCMCDGWHSRGDLNRSVRYYCSDRSQWFKIISMREKSSCTRRLVVWRKVYGCNFSPNIGDAEIAENKIKWYLTVITIDYIDLKKQEFYIWTQGF